MVLLLILLPYLLVPILAAFFCKRRKLIPAWLSYVLTAILITLYPFLLFWIDQLLSQREVKCLNPEFAVLMWNLVFMVPTSLVLQFIFNNVLSTGKQNPLF